AAAVVNRVRLPLGADQLKYALAQKDLRPGIPGAGRGGGPARRAFWVAIADLALADHLARLVKQHDEATLYALNQARQRYHLLTNVFQRQLGIQRLARFIQDSKEVVFPFQLLHPAGKIGQSAAGNSGAAGQWRAIRAT